MAVACQDCPLRKLNSFESISGEEEAFVQNFKVGELKVKAGATVLKSGALSPHLFTILSGAGTRVKVLPDGRRQIINFLFPGDLIGLQAGLLDAMKHGTDASTDMVLCMFRRDRLPEIFRNHPEQAYDLTWLAATEAATLGGARVLVGRRGARERIAYLFNYIMARAAQSGFADGADVTRFPFRQQDVADASGLSLVHTNKMIQDLRGAKLIRLAGGRLTVLDPDGLREAAVIPAEDVANQRPRPLL